MAVEDPVKVPEKKVSSVDVPKFDGGMFGGEAQNAPINCFVSSKDIELDKNGYIIPRRRLTPFLPDTVETTYEKAPMLWAGQLYYFTADDNKIKFCQEGDAAWTDCATPGVAATLTTALAGANNDLVFTSRALGATGNSIAIIYLNPGTPSAALSVTVSTTVITVHLATSGASAITSTASLILAAIQASTAASALVTVALAPANTGAGVVTALGSTPLAGGSGTNIITTNNGGMPTFHRVLDSVLVTNGKNGDKLCYVDLTTPGFPVVKYSLVTDPPSALTDSLAGLTTGAQNIYYAFSYTGAVGETLLSPILTQTLNIPRDQWQTLATPGKITLTRPGSPPAGAEFWNLYVANAATGGVIQTTDMLRLATKLDLANTTFVDDGSLSINLGSVAPIANSTDGPRVSHGIVEDGNPILYGDEDNPYNLHIGGGGPYALDFSISNGGYLAQPEQGTNYYPNVVVGFRTGQGIPALTVLYSNTEGLSKQSTLQQQTVNYGNQSFTVWGVTEQHYGAAGVAAPNSAINYNGKLMFLSTDGFLAAETQPTIQNILSINPVGAPVDDLIHTIKNSAMPTVVGAGWNNKFMWLAPTGGFDTPQQIVVLDTNNKGVDGKGAWDTLNIPANWIGVISPQNDAAFVYISQGNKTYKLLTGNATFDVKNGVPVPFSTGATGALMGMGGQVHNEWQADVQAMFNVLGLIGDITVGVNYRNQNGQLKTKTKIYHGPAYTPSSAGGWGDPGWGYSYGPALSSEPAIDDSAGSVVSVDVRIPVRIDDIFNEAQWFYLTPTGYSNYKLKAISYEGIALGIRPDLQ